ncbi:MAG: hypothetical protein LBM25_00880 [Bacteroidales bacterium]|jgi:hypothetical protein|nr:hypothetical protein [Bacteroidales bacterium]
MKKYILIILKICILYSCHRSDKKRDNISFNDSIEQVEKHILRIKEYKLKDSSLYDELNSILFSYSIFKNQSIYFLALRYDTTFTNYVTGEKINASLNIFDIIDNAHLLSITNNGAEILGYFYINNVVCFMLNPIEKAFLSKYFISTNKYQNFKIEDSFSCTGGSTDIYMNITINNKIKIEKIILSE